jgi:hypothetical protein
MIPYYIGTATLLRPGDPAPPAPATRDNPATALCDAWSQAASGPGIPFVYRVALSPDARVVVRDEPLTAQLAWKAIQITAAGSNGSEDPERLRPVEPV